MIASPLLKVAVNELIGFLLRAFALMSSSITALLDQIFDDSAFFDQVDKAAFEKWVRPSFQNYEAGDSFCINPNEKLLTELVEAMAQPSTGQLNGPNFRVGRILLVTQYAPSFSHAGGLRLRDMYAKIRKFRPDIIIDLYCEANPAIDGDLTGLADIFDNIYLEQPGRLSVSVFRSMAGYQKNYDLVDLQFHVAGKLAKDFRAIASRVIFTPMECISRSYFELVKKKFERENRISLTDIFGLIHTSVDELRIVRAVDHTVAVSDADAAFLRRLSPKSTISHISTGLSDHEFSRELSQDFIPRDVDSKQKKLIFAAYFGSDTNLVGLRWYLEQVHPLVIQQCPDYELMVVGRGDLTWLSTMQLHGVTIVGEVPFLAPVLEQARGGLVLALHGSGFRGKINQYSVCGVPSISTRLGTTGLDYTDGENILVADEAFDFAQACINILSDVQLNREISAKARALALEKYRWESIWGEFQAVYGLGL